MPTGPPDSKLLDYWATLSSCLTDLDMTVDPAEMQLHPAYLNELTRLTRLVFCELDDPGGLGHGGGWPHYALRLPELKVLCLDYLRAGNLELQCPQLKVLRIEDCVMGRLDLQASLEHLHFDNVIRGSRAPKILHEGFPITNLDGLTYLNLDVDYDIKSQAVLFHRLPLMTQLQALHLHINECSLPAKLPSSLRDLTVAFKAKRVWDSSVILLVQQLPAVESIGIYVELHHSAFIGDLSLDHDLRPFLAMKSLRHLWFGSSQAWKGSALRQLGELEAEVMRLGKNLKLSY